ncbi:SLC13 family permease [Tropicibacter sp. Alg240-R139]|uniref:SLC13 family permease n=1 Tax=Tropicibacter sp. Alg240-R139 TaxID=2305991 RepID=UPI0019677249|nr:SLC13 family permease [Tropicibacter sp. Alg240-R139]
MIALLTSLVAIGLLIAGQSGVSVLDVDPAMSRALGVVIFTLGLWITGVVPEFFTSLLFLFLSSLLAIAPPDVVFSGFYSSALWLIFGGLVLGHAVTQSGLGDWLVHRLAALSAPGYLGALTTIALAGLLLSFIVPTAIGRVVLMAPIAVHLAKRLGFQAGSNGQAGLVLTAGMSTSLPAFTILPSNVPNLVMSGSAEGLYGVTFTYSDYFLVNFPVLGLFSCAATIALNWWFFHEPPEQVTTVDEAEPLTAPQVRLTVVLAFTVLMWITDYWYGIAPAWVAMGAALFCALPGVGIIPVGDLPQKINIAPIFFVAGVIGFGAAVAATGISTWAGGSLVAMFHQANLTNNIAIFGALTAIGSLVAVGTTVPTAPGVMTPLAGQLATATGWSVESVLLAQVQTWVLVPFPYLVPPLLLTLSIGRIPSGQAVRLLLCYFALGILVFAPLHFVWVRWLGYFSG